MTQNKTLTDNEAQEKEDLIMSLYKIHAYIPNDAEGNPLTPFGNFACGYETAQQESAREIAELKEQVHNLNWALGTDGYEQMATVEQQLEYKEGLKKIEARIANMKHRKDKITELQSQVNMLRESLTFIALLSGNPKGERRYDLIWEKSNEALKQIEVSE